MVSSLLKCDQLLHRKPEDERVTLASTASMLGDTDQKHGMRSKSERMSTIGRCKVKDDK